MGRGVAVGEGAEVGSVVGVAVCSGEALNVVSTAAVIVVSSEGVAVVIESGMVPSTTIATMQVTTIFAFPFKKRLMVFCHFSIGRRSKPASREKRHQKFGKYMRVPEKKNIARIQRMTFLAVFPMTFICNTPF